MAGLILSSAVIVKHTFYLSIPTNDLPGAAGNFLAPISGLSENGFRTVIEIDTVGPLWFCFLDLN